MGLFTELNIIINTDRDGQNDCGSNDGLKVKPYRDKNGEWILTGVVECGSLLYDKITKELDTKTFQLDDSVLPF